MSERRPSRAPRGLGIARGERAPAFAFVMAIAGAIGLFVVYLRGGQPQAEGILLAVALGGIGVGMTLWVARFMPHGPFVEDRGRMASTDEEAEAFIHDFEAGGEEIARRGFLARLLTAAF